MKQKIINVLSRMVREDGSIGVKSYREISDDTFQLETQLSEFGHQTWLRFEPTGDMELFRVELTHVFGYLDIQLAPNIAANQLLRMLAKNTGSFETTTAFVGVQQGRDNNKLYVTLNSFHHFVSAWSDEDIAKALSLHFFDLTMGLMTKDTSLTILKMFGDES